MKKKGIIRLCIYLLFYFSITVLLFVIVEKTPLNTANLNLVERRIETPIKLFFNGHFGVFFNLMYVGSVSWIIIPLSIFYFIKNRNNFRFIVPFGIFLFLCISLIGFKGYFNERYQLTVLLVVLLLISFLLFKILDVRNFRFSLLFLVVLSVASFSYYFKTNFYPKFISKTTKNYTSFGSVPLKKDLNIHIRDSLSRFIFVVDNIPKFYYENKRVKGYYYTSTTDILFLPNKKKRLLKDAKSSFVFLKDSLHVKYFLTSTKKQEFNDEFKKYLHLNFKAILKDENGVLLFEMK
jgi:hypothetical protein